MNVGVVSIKPSPTLALVCGQSETSRISLNYCKFIACINYNALTATRN